jgi:hypothetical protein
MRCSSEAGFPVANGPRPDAANTSTAPSANMSLGGPIAVPVICSGDR